MVGSVYSEIIFLFLMKLGSIGNGKILLKYDEIHRYLKYKNKEEMWIKKIFDR